MSNVPEVNIASEPLKYDELLRELTELSSRVKLLPDPLSVGLNYFTEKYAELQAVRERVLAIVQMALWNRSSWESQVSYWKQVYSSKFAEILVREDVRPLKSTDLREAVANNELKDILNNVETAERNRTIADAFYKNAWLVYEDLKDKNNNLNQQLVTVRSMLSINLDLKDTLDSKQSRVDISFPRGG